MEHLRNIQECQFERSGPGMKKGAWFGRRAALGLEVLRSMRRGYFHSVVRVNGLTVTVR
jgi:hypothetical protein